MTRADSWTGAVGPSAIIGALLVILASAAASAHSYKLGQITIGHIWAPPTAGASAETAVYGAVLNQGDRPARLIGASTPAAESARFRIERDGRVQWPVAIELPPGKPVSLAPWREHIWLTGPRRPLKSGDAFDLTLDFGKAGSLTVVVVVEESPGH